YFHIRWRLIQSAVLFYAYVLNVMNDGGKIKINADGSEVTFPDAQPFIDENSRTQIPIRAVAESIGCKVEYDAASQTVSIDGSDENIVLRIGDENMDVNGETVKMDTAARIVDDRTYIPVRFVAEALGFEVDYLTDTNQN
ncbi:MAG: copper amine oxidase N-terminal domain-containing protein, partial [bacterium]|nr:copper amine oxidase N-terminal domain-containing protein [bacterium]